MVDYFNGLMAGGAQVICRCNLHMITILKGEPFVDKLLYGMTFIGFKSFQGEL